MTLWQSLLPQQASLENVMSSQLPKNIEICQQEKKEKGSNHLEKAIKSLKAWVANAKKQTAAYKEALKLVANA